jgi:hypothetical protein
MEDYKNNKTDTQEKMEIDEINQNNETKNGLHNESDLKSWKVDDLKAELKKRNVSFSKSYKKQDLIDLLLKEK